MRGRICILFILLVQGSGAFRITLKRQDNRHRFARRTVVLERTLTHQSRKDRITKNHSVEESLAASNNSLAAARGAMKSKSDLALMKRPAVSVSGQDDQFSQVIPSDASSSSSQVVPGQVDPQNGIKWLGNFVLTELKAEAKGTQDFFKNFDALLKQCEKCSDLLGVVLEEKWLGDFPGRGVVVLVTQLVDMLANTQWLGDPTMPADQLLSRSQRILTAILASLSKEGFFEFKDCVTVDAAGTVDAEDHSKILTAPCLLSAMTSFLSGAMKGYFYELFAVMLSCIKDMYKAMEKLQAAVDKDPKNPEIATPLWELSIASGRLIAFIAIGLTAGKSPALIANSVGKVIGELAPKLASTALKKLNKVDLKKHKAQFMNLFESARDFFVTIEQPSSFPLFVPGLGEACVDRLAVRIFQDPGGNLLTPNRVLNHVPEALAFAAFEEWFTIDQVGSISNVLDNFLQLQFTGPEKVHVQMIQERYAKVTAPEKPVGDLERKQEACKEAWKICSNRLSTTDTAVVEFMDAPTDLKPEPEKAIDDDMDFAFDVDRRYLGKYPSSSCCLLLQPPSVSPPCPAIPVWQEPE